MGFGSSLFLIAVGAIMDFAVKVHTAGFDVNKIGLILMIVGIIGLVLSLIFWGSWGGVGGGYRRTTRRTTATPLVGGDVRRGVVAQDAEYVETERRY